MAMTTSNSILGELNRYHRWATEKVWSLCDGVSDEELDRERRMGFGSLRATLFHLLSAERLWMDRWTGKPWAPLETDPAGMSATDLRQAMMDAIAERQV
jgi:uncharacterized damage-inducible protein DinB